MNTYFALAGTLALVFGVVHSVVGELLIFRRLSNVSPAAAASDTELPTCCVRHMRTAWHVVTIFAWGFGAVLLRLSLASSQYASETFAVSAILFSMLAASLIGLVGSGTKHPGWLVLPLIAIFLWLG